MTWQLASFALLGLALVAGFAWYERVRPSARLVALVATLAALAVLGRVAFAPVPNVKPTTDIVLLAGYVLGGAPGFAVGAVAALASNLFFGQGPFTPWQMAGWGAVGVFGAVLARAFGRDLGRLPLAAVCGAAGLAFGAWMDLHLWVLYTDHRPAAYAAIAATSLPFNIAHAVGNVLFCLVFGPALVRALRRFRDRSEIVWHPAPAAAAATLLVLVVVAAQPASAEARDRTVQRAVAYLKAAQTPGGGFAAARGVRAADEMQSGWAIMGLAAAGRHPSDVRRPGGRSAAQYIQARARQVSYPGDVSRTVLALRAAGLPAGALARRLERAQRANGSVLGLVNQTSFAVLALRAAGRSAGARPVRRAAAFIAAQQNEDGGWNFGGKGARSGVDDTAAAIQALAAAGRRSSTAVRRGVRWLLGRQALDGGFTLGGGPTNAQSTAWAVQALVAAGRDPRRVRRAGSRTPIAFLRSLQNPDGSIRYSRTNRQTPTWVTGQVLPALRLEALPVRAPKRARAATATAAAAPAATPAAAADAPAEPAERREQKPRQKAVARRPSTRALADDARRAGAMAARILGAIVA